MKRNIFSALIVVSALTIVSLSLLGSNRALNVGQTAPEVASPSNIYEGMLLDEFWEIYPRRGNTFEIVKGCSWMHDGYIFISDDQDNPVVITVSDNSKGKSHYLTSVVAYDKNAIVVSEETFRSIEKGMTLHEVVSLVGNPYGNPDTAGLTLGWHCGDNIRFCVRWGRHPNDSNVLIVEDVYRADDAAGTYECITE
jgi:hypothetical protein